MSFLPAIRRVTQSEPAYWLLAACALFLIAGAGLRPLSLPDEGRYVDVAWEMLNSGNWLVPTLDGMPFFHKPPLFYWITAAAFKLFGAYAWAGRLASTLSAIAIMVAMHAFVRRHRDAATANLTAVILTTQPFFFGAAQFANLDMLVASMISLTVLCAADASIAIQENRHYKRPLTAAYVFAALGVLAKGLIGFLLPAIIILVWLALKKKTAIFFRLLNLPLMGLFLLIAGSWFVAMQREFPEFIDYFFVYHHFRRFTESGFNNQLPFWFYVPLLLLLTLPWSLWCAGFIRQLRFWRQKDANGLQMLMLLWILVIIVFFSLPKSKLAGYILPALAPFTFLLADSIRQRLHTSPQANTEAWLGASIVMGMIFCASIVAFMIWHEPSRLNHLTARSTQDLHSNSQVVMLDQYQYDLPFYLQLRKPPWVVSNWQDPSIQKIDNWRKELLDAGKFSAQAKQENLISAEELIARLCAQRENTYWIWAAHTAPQNFRWLAGAELVFSNDRNSLWKFRPKTPDLNALCGGMPSSDQTQK